MKNLPLYDLYKKLNEALSREELTLLLSLIEEKEKIIETSATGGPSINVGSPYAGGTSLSRPGSRVGPVTPSNPPSTSTTLNGPNWINGDQETGDLNTPYNPSGNNRTFLKTPAPMGRNHGSKTGKKSREKKLDMRALRDILKQKKSGSTMEPTDRPKKVMSFDNFLKTDMNTVTKVKEGRAYKDTKSPKDKTIGKGGVKITDRISDFQGKIKSHIGGFKGVDVKNVGNDFEIHKGGEIIAQVMFRPDYIGVRKNGVKFVDEFKYIELGKIKSEITKIINGKKD